MLFWHAYDKRNVLTLLFVIFRLIPRLTSLTVFEVTGFMCQFSSVWFSSLTDWLVGEMIMIDDSAEILFQSFSAGGPCEQFWHGQNCSLFDVVHPSFSLPTTALPTLLCALRGGVGEAVVACDMPEPCKLPSLDSCRKSFLLKSCIFRRLKILI